MNHYDDLQKKKISHRYFPEDEVEIDYFRQQLPVLQFRSRSIIQVRIAEIIDEMDFFTSSRGTNWAMTRLKTDVISRLSVDAS